MERGVLHKLDGGGKERMEMVVARMCRGEEEEERERKREKREVKMR
jgi:hypothetical protein